MSKLAIIIPTFNRKTYLYNILIDFKNQDYINCYKVIVVVDGSNDGTIEMLKLDFPNVSIVEGNGNWWWTKSINEGLKYALKNKFSEFLLMNDDTSVETFFLTNLLKLYNSNSNRGVLGAISITKEVPFRIFYSGTKRVNWFFAKHYKYHKLFEKYNNTISGIHKTVFIPGRGMLFDLNVLNEIGYLNEEQFPQYYSDFDFSYSAYKKGIPTNISWDTPIYSHVELTAKGNNTDTSFVEFIMSFFEKMSPNNLKKTFIFYSKHGGVFFIIGFIFHILRRVASIVNLKLKN